MDYDKRPQKPTGSESIAGPRGDGPQKGEHPPDRSGDSPTLGRKAPVPAARLRKDQSPADSDRGPQLPRRTDTADTGEGYVRMRLRVQDRRVEVISSQFVAGPLRAVTEIHGNTFYEVTDGSRLLSADAVPDIDVVRSFANPDGPLEQRRHHTYQSSSYEFDARIPVALLKGRSLGAVSVVLYRTQEALASHNLTTEPLSKQISVSVDELGRLDGLTANDLPVELRGRTGERKPSDTAS